MDDHVDLVAQEEHLFAVTGGKRFRRMEGLSAEIPFFIYPFDATRANQVTAMTGRLVNRLAAEGVAALEINLQRLTVGLLRKRGVWERLMELEPELSKDDFREVLQGMLDPEEHLAPAIRQIVEVNASDMVFLTGIGGVFPYIRSHNVLNNLQTTIANQPLVVFFPGTYAQTPNGGSSLVLFGIMRDDQYYRAKNILDQEA